MTHLRESHTPKRGRHICRRASFPRSARYTVLITAAAAVAAAACQDSVVPFLTGVTAVPGTPTGVQQAVTGLFSYTRNDQKAIVLELSAFAREAANFTNTDSRYITYSLGITPIGHGVGWFTTWANAYENIREAQQILASLPTVVPTYSAQNIAAITGVVQTIEALNYMFIAWAHDSLGLAIMQSPNATTQAPAVCTVDGLRYIIALLDSANNTLNTVGPVPLPIKVPPGFAAVSAIAAPSTTLGSFASFNRALAAKAGLQLAYAIARQQPGTTPTPTSAGNPNVAALTRADSAMTASALYNPAALAPNPQGQWTEDNYSVLHDFSTQSGDQTNPINGVVGTQAVLNEVPSNQDTVNDLRWKAKFLLNPHPVQEQAYSFVASKYIYGMYPSPASPIPIVRNETLVLVRAQIRLGLGDLPGALALLNDVRTTVGGLAPVAAAGYVAVRDALMREQQISTLMEGGADRVIALRMYGLEAVLDTTWTHTHFGPDLHTTIEPIPEAELIGRGGTFNTTCN